MNAQGARGSQYIGVLFVGSEFLKFYVRDQNTNFTYRVLDATNTAGDLLVQLNGLGARGFRLESLLTARNYCVRENTAKLTDSYEPLAAPTTTSRFLTQANDRGVRGF